MLAEQRLAEFVKPYSRNISIRKSQAKGLGIYSQTDIEPGTAVVNVPRSMFISRSNLLQIDDQVLKMQYDSIPNISERLAIILFILHVSFSKSCKSSLKHAYSPWVESLPDVVLTCLSWNEDSPEYKLLAGTGLQHSIQQKLQKLEREFASLKFGPEITLDHFAWADFVFWSRSMSLGSFDKGEENDILIAPILDFANHSLEPNASWHLEEDGIVLVVDKFIPSDTEICISYGEKTNSELLFLHGFALNNNPFTSIAIPAPFMEYQQQPEEDGLLDATIRNKTILMKKLKLGKLIVLNRPNQNETEWNPTRGLCSDDALLALYICVVCADDGITFTEKHVKFDDEIMSPLDIPTLKDCIKNHPLYPVFSLRIWTILQQAINFHLQLLSDEQGEIQNMRMKYATYVRQDQESLLLEASVLIDKLIEQYSILPKVMEYLEKVNLK